MRRPLSFLLLLVFALLPAAQSHSQGTKGRLEAKVVDTGGEGLPGANLTVKGTYYGGASNIDGDIKIENIAAGSYTVEVSLLGRYPGTSASSAPSTAI